MHTLTPTSPLLPPLFEANIPNHPILFALLAGHFPGEALVDSAERPTAALVRTPDGITFPSAGAPHPFVNAGIAQLRQSGPVILIARKPQSFYPPLDVRFARLEFLDLDPAAAPLANWVKTLPGNYRIRPLDEDLLARCAWKDLIERIYGKTRAFLACGFGFCILEDDAIVAEAYAVFTGRGHIEMGIVTAETHQGRGLATAASACLAQEILLRGSRPYWSCDADNLPSASVARKLGFRREQPYELYGYRTRKA